MSASTKMTEELTPQQAIARIMAGDVVRVVVGDGNDDPILMVRLGKAYGEDYILTTAVWGWSEGITEPVCRPGKVDFLAEIFLADASSLIVVPDGRNIYGLEDYAL